MLKASPFDQKGVAIIICLAIRNRQPALFLAVITNMFSSAFFVNEWSVNTHRNSLATSVLDNCDLFWLGYSS